MKLITNKISTGKAMSFEDFVNRYRSEKQIKTASTKTAAEQEEADSSGQLDVEPLHQKGESTTMPKAGPNAKKEADDKSTTTDPEAEGKDSGQPKAEGSEKFTNDPKAPSKEEKGGSTEEKVKVAEINCSKCDKPCAECECEACDCKSCTAARKEAQTKEAGIKGNCSKCGKPNFICKGKCSGDDGDSKDDSNDSKDDSNDDKEEKKAQVEEEKEEKKEKKKEEEKKAKAVGFVRIANLDEKNKGFLREYWKQLYGEDYVNALISDK